MRWDTADISFEMLDDLNDPVVTLLVMTPVGRLMISAEPATWGGTLVLAAFHFQGLAANAVGVANLMVIARALMERLDFDGLIIEGAVRATGANRGHRPRGVRFTRRVLRVGD